MNPTKSTGSHLNSVKYVSNQDWVLPNYGDADLTWDYKTPSVPSTSKEVEPLENAKNEVTQLLHQTSFGKRVQTFPVKVLDWDEDQVKTEFLLDRDEGIYEVRFFPIEIFEGTHFLQQGFFLRADLFIGKGESRILFEDGSTTVSEEDFPENSSLDEVDFDIFKFE